MQSRFWGLQLSDFLGSRLAAQSGIMALPDVFCLFNRARGTELVSPDDLLAAVRLFPSISAPLHVRSFPSGLVVVESNSHSDAEVGAPHADRGWQCRAEPGEDVPSA